MSKRAQRRTTGRKSSGAAVFAAAILLIGVAAVFTITVALDSMTGGPATSMCHVDTDQGQARLNPEQMGNAALITGVGMEMGVDERAVIIALATAMQESSLRNLDHGDRDSLGLFQQRPSQGWGTPEQVQDRVYASRIFYERLLQIPGYEEMELTDAAQTVQISAFPRAYAKHEGLATALTTSLTGRVAGSLTCTLPGEPELDHGRLLDELALAHPGATAAAVGDQILLGGQVDEWALAHWLVATAERTGVSAVEIPGHQWTRHSGWRASDEVVSGVFAS